MSKFLPVPELKTYCIRSEYFTRRSLRSGQIGRCLKFLAKELDGEGRFSVPSPSMVYDNHIRFRGTSKSIKLAKVMSSYLMPIKSSQKLSSENLPLFFVIAVNVINGAIEQSMVYRR